MAALALALYGLYLSLAFLLRTALHRRRTGRSGFSGISGAPGSAEWLGGVLFALAILLGVAAPVLALADVVEPLDFLDRTAAHVSGIVLYAGGLLGTLAAQAAMGRSWRIGVDEAERTDLVTGGPFSLVRNPIFATMLPTSLGLALMVPSVVAFAACAALLVALEIQTRLVEEPYLRRVHGPEYARYAERTGRFVPGLGRLTS